jgi:hypothetical protein
VIKTLNHFFQLGVFLEKIPKAILIGDDFSIAEHDLDFIEAVF